MATPQDNAYKPHNHNLCIKSALQEARTLCQNRGARLTPLREKVLELVWQNHQPVGAYDILAELARQESRPAQPPTVYRALEFLLEQGLVHRLSSINAYIGCPNPDSHSSKVDQSCFLICENCRITIEMENPVITQALNDCAKEHRFSVSSSTIELTGLCTNCSKSKHSHD
ncbi:transcriptional repressor [Endozoicomonas sp. Mp262]|uniref:Fur family transcriptional regulator n=1 Tax=Endozoicomonas sp. Mp262 TaxID=2919499 RepID=UPI0021D8621A